MPPPAFKDPALIGVLIVGVVGGLALFLFGHGSIRQFGIGCVFGAIVVGALIWWEDRR